MKALLATLLLFWSLLPLVAAALEREDRVRLGASVLRVEAPRNDGGGASFGSAVAVAHEAVVTNCHVTRDAERILVVLGGLRHSVSAQAVDVEHDLCLLQVPGLRAPAVTLGRAAELAIGQPLTALGYTGGAALRASAGKVVQLHRHDAAHVIQSSTGFSSGASGGGLFDEGGRLVGVLTFRLRGGDHYFAAPAEWVQALLDSAAQGRFAEVAPIGHPRLAFWETPESTRPRFLQAAALQQGARWTELQAYARAWLRLTPSDAEPWALLGLSLVSAGRMPEGRTALECALRLDATHRSARAWLARTLPASTRWLDGLAPCEVS